MSTSNANRDDLPDDVLLEILQRLPVKTLLRCKFVCKKWKAIITSHSFVNQHYEHGSNKEHLIVGRFIPEVYGNAYNLFVDDTLSVFEEPAHLQLPVSVEKVMGPVNGVLFLVGDMLEMAMLNPAMRQYKQLPEQPDVFDEQHIYVHGFGFDPLNGDFKVVLICYLWGEIAEAQHYPPLVSVYSSSSNSWKDVVPFKSGYRANSFVYNQYLNGIYYWILGEVYTAGIIAFDMSSEIFQEIEVPDCVKSKMLRLTVRGDSLALLTCESQNMDIFEVWLMEKEGNWNRIAVVGPSPDIKSACCFWKNNELVLRCSTSVFSLYDIFTQEIRHPAAAEFRLGTSILCTVFSYKESLFSIKGAGDNCILWDVSAYLSR